MIKIDPKYSCVSKYSAPCYYKEINPITVIGGNGDGGVWGGRVDTLGRDVRSRMSLTM